MRQLLPVRLIKIPGGFKILCGAKGVEGRIHIYTAVRSDTSGMEGEELREFSKMVARAVRHTLTIANKHGGSV